MLVRLRAGALRLWAKQNAHSLYVIVAALLAGGTLILDLLLHEQRGRSWLTWSLLVLCLVFAVVVALLGKRFPLGAGLACVVLFTLASLYFMSPLSDEQSAVSTAQELPMVALYLGWFLRQSVGRTIVLVFAGLLVAVMAWNPLFHVDGSLGLTNAVQILLVLLLCFEIGSILWRQSERQFSTDQLTGALSRGAFFDRLERELAVSARSERRSCLVVIDFDRFKQLNDTLGHAAGDRALIDTVGHWRDELRRRDVIGRIGGDEFALLILRTEAEGAESIMRRLRAGSAYAWSWGVAEVMIDDDAERLLARADRALYAAKRVAR